MAHYLVTAKPDRARLPELAQMLRDDAYATLHPFGASMSRSLKHARLRQDGYATWEEEDYCTPPLAQEREAALDRFFHELQVVPVRKGEGWTRIHHLPFLFPEPNRT